MPHPPTQFENPNPTDPVTSPITEEGEILLYGLQGMLSALSIDMKVTPRGEPQGTQAALNYLFLKVKDRARMVHDCLYMARVLIEEASTLVDTGIDWQTIEELYCPPERDCVEDQWSHCDRSHALHARVAVAAHYSSEARRLQNEGDPRFGKPTVSTCTSSKSARTMRRPPSVFR